MAWHWSHTLGLSRHTNERAKIARSAFTGIISVTRKFMTVHYVVYGAPGTPIRLLLVSNCYVPVTVLDWQVNCGYLCSSKNTQWLIFSSNVWNNLPFAPHPLLPPNLPPINWIWYWWGWKSVWDFSSISLQLIQWIWHPCTEASKSYVYSVLII